MKTIIIALGLFTAASANAGLFEERISNASFSIDYCLSPENPGFCDIWQLTNTSLDIAYGPDGDGPKVVEFDTFSDNSFTDNDPYLQANYEFDDRGDEQFISIRLERDFVTSMRVDFLFESIFFYMPQNNGEWHASKSLTVVDEFGNGVSGYSYRFGGTTDFIIPTLGEIQAARVPTQEPYHYLR